jgi:choline kinase
MIGMVLAAGAGRRLRPYTDTLPKALVPVDGETTILDIALRNLAEVGLTDVVIVVGYCASAVQERQAALEAKYGVKITLVHNDKAEEWNNAYSMWLAREHFAKGVLMVNGDTVHPVSIEKTLLTQREMARLRHDEGPGILLASDFTLSMADEEMKVTLDAEGHLARITKLMDPADAYGEYIGATLIEPEAAEALADALKATWEGDPDLYYEDGYQELVNRGGTVAVAPIGAVDWVEVDNHEDLAKARKIAGTY